MSAKVLLFLGAAAAALAGGKKIVNNTGILGRAFDWARAASFASFLPAVLRPYAQHFLNAAQTYDVNPWVLAGICYRESLGGTQLRPQGPTGTGDFTPRGASSTYFRFANPSTGLPPDGKGWGRGLMQIDFGAHNAWVLANQWWDPQININKAAEILRSRLDFFASSPSSGVVIDCWRINSGMPQIGIQPWKTKYPSAPFPPCNASRSAVALRDPRPLAGVALQEAAVAAYNAGPAGVLQAIALGLPAEAPTAGQDYVSYFTTRIASWSASF